MSNALFATLARLDNKHFKQPADGVQRAELHWYKVTMDDGSVYTTTAWSPEDAKAFCEEWCNERNIKATEAERVERTRKVL